MKINENVTFKNFYYKMCTIWFLMIEFNVNAMTWLTCPIWIQIHNKLASNLILFYIKLLNSEEEEAEEKQEEL